MARSSLYSENITNKELDEKWIEVYEKDIHAAESFADKEKIKYVLIGLIVGFSVNIGEIIIRKKKAKTEVTDREIGVGKVEASNQKDRRQSPDDLC